MATIIKTISLCLYLLFSGSLGAHTIYAPNDIPLLDNRFRVDPKTEQITFILNHSRGSQLVVLVRPDGSKLYPQNHPESVGWVNGKTQDIITITNPMVGPWQAIAQLDGDNRIKLISDVTLKTTKLPLTLYAKEYITTHASLYYDDKIMRDAAYLSDAKLRVALLGGASKKQLMLYKDDGKNYDALPFDGELTARLYIDLKPGRYLLNLSTKNNVFIRNINKDAVVFPTPITYKIQPTKSGNKKAFFEFKINSDEIDPQSVTIDGVFKNSSKKVVAQLITHSKDNISTESVLLASKELPFSTYTFSAKAFATTRKGREIELQLPERFLELLPQLIIPKEKVSNALATEKKETTKQPETNDETTDANKETSWFDNLWVILAITMLFLIIIMVVFLLLWRKHKKQKQSSTDELAINKLAEDELQPASINLDADKK